DLLRSCSKLQSGADMTACARCIHMRIGGIECNAQQLNQLGGHHSAGVDPGAGGHETIGPDGIELEKPVPCFIPLADGTYFVDSRSCGGSFLRCLYSGGLGLLQKNGSPET